MTDGHRLLPRLAATLLAVAALGPVPGAEAQSIERELAAIVDGTGWAGAGYSVLAVSLETGDTLFAREPYRALAPASNVKLLTSAAALHHLGPGFRYRTFLLSDAPVRDGVVEGDLVLYGTGDPGLSDRFYESRTTVFERMAAQLAARGVHTVRGDIVGDGSYFEGPLLAEGWDPRDLNDWFAAPADALSFNENVVTLRVEPAATAGLRPTVRTLPQDARIAVDNRATTARGRLQINREVPTEPVRIEGAVPVGGREVWRQVTVGNPARYAAQILRNVLESEGFRVEGGVRTVRDPTASTLTRRAVFAPAADRPGPTILAVHQSPPLAEYLEVVNKKSHNLLAELILKTFGRIVEGEGSYAAGARVMEDFLASEVGADTTAVRLSDGSGLSTENRMSAADFTRLIAYMSESDLWESYWATLPEAGNPEELRRMYRSAAAGNLRAKTGTIENASALSGLVRSSAGERIAFSILANDVPSTWGAKRVEDRLGEALASLDRPFEVREVRLAGPVDEPAPAEEEDEPTRVAVATEPDAGPAGVAGSAAPGQASDDAAAGEADVPDAADSETAEARPTEAHVVRPGENFTVIARQHGISLNALVEANPGRSSRRLQPGMELNIPAPAEPGPAPQERQDPDRHQVAAGENLTVIARRYGVSLNDLLDANPGITPRRLLVGQWVTIPDPTGGA